MAVVLAFPGATVTPAAVLPMRQISNVVPLPVSRRPAHTARRGRSGGGGVISWLHTATCARCGRPTLHGSEPVGQVVLCGHCHPLSAA